MKNKLKNIKNTLDISICIPAYNEEKNIGKLLKSLVNQKTERIVIKKIVVVSSGSIDNTDKIVKKYCLKYNKIMLIRENVRNGKASAINTFLRYHNELVVVIQSADTIAAPDTIENLCLPFLYDKKIGMTGGAPIPVNDPNTFLGYIIHTWWWFHRNIPRFGEIIAFRNVIGELSTTTAVDEAYIQAKVIKKGYKLFLADDALVYNKGAENLMDLIKQRRRVFNGHNRLHKEEEIKVANIASAVILLLFLRYKVKNIKEITWIIGGIAIEIVARLLGYYDTKIAKDNPFVWDIARTTKNVNI